MRAALLSTFDRTKIYRLVHPVFPRGIKTELMQRSERAEWRTTRDDDEWAII